MHKFGAKRVNKNNNRYEEAVNVRPRFTPAAQI